MHLAKNQGYWWTRQGDFAFQLLQQTTDVYEVSEYEESLRQFTVKLYILERKLYSNDIKCSSTCIVDSQVERCNI